MSDKLDEFLKETNKEYAISPIRAINEKIIQDAGKIILQLLFYIDTSNRNGNKKKDKTILKALNWIKNHKL